MHIDDSHQTPDLPDTDEHGPGRALTTDTELHDELAYILQAAHLHQAWFFFLDRDQRIMAPIIPMPDIPDTPDEPVDFGEFGDPELGTESVSYARMLVDRLHSIMRMIEAHSVVLAWERTGPDRFTDADLAWALAVAEEARGGGVPVRAQFLVHDHGLRQITPDDYA